MKIFIATRNRHKLRELSLMLGSHDIHPLPEGISLPPETGETFAANALAKARAAAAALECFSIADDSGIESAALGGAPGVLSARYAGPDATDRENLEKLLAEAPDESAVRYVCAIAAVDPDGTEKVFEGICKGSLTSELRGTGGFGYDPAFVPDDDHSNRTMAELTAAEKHVISHRGRAVRELLAWLETR